MSFDIQISDLTNSTTASDGTGIYDLLMKAVVRHIESQYEQGRISGADYANVYLGSMQSVLAESVRFLLQEKQSGEQAALIAEQVKSEAKNNETDGIIDQQNKKLQEEIDLIVTQIDKAGKENLLIEAQKSKVDEEALLVTSERSEIAANATAQRSKLSAETTLLSSRNTEQIAATVRLDDESNKRTLLMEAQTVGFKTDAKQKLMRQLYEGYAVNVTTLGEVTDSPTGSTAAALDAVANDILDDLSSSVNI